MKLFIAVVFFCSGAECAFWKGQDNYYNTEECQVKVQETMAYFETQGVPSFGVCLPVDTKNNI